MRLIVHIGSGKSGSTSIQAWCRNNTEELQKHRARYLGLYFEETPHSSCATQSTAHQQFFRDLRAKEGTAATTLRRILPAIIDDAAKDGIETLIWSNEALFSAYDELGECIAEINRLVPVTLVAYIRRQESWLLSAYQQWGIKHKTVQGPVPDFTTWVEQWISECDYASIFSEWEHYIEKENISIGIVERTDNVVADFCNRCGLDIKLPEKAGGVNNARLRNTQASLYKLYNDCFLEPKQQVEMQQFLTRTGITNRRFDEADASLGYPDWETVSALSERFSEGNNLLKRYAREGDDLSFPQLKQLPPPCNETSNDALTSALLMSLVNCEARIAELEQKLA